FSFLCWSCSEEMPRRGLIRASGLFLIAWLMVGTGCALTTGYSEQRTTQTNERRCAPTEGDQQLRRVALDVIDQAEEDPLVHASHGRVPTSFSWRAIKTAHAIDVLPLINQLELAEELPLLDASRQIRILSLRQEVLGRVLLAMIAVSSTAAHVGCEIERTYQVADRLKNSEQARIKQQTLLAVIIGAGAAIASGGFSLVESAGEGIAGIIGGTIAGSLGISALYQESEQHFEHPDNVLREVWEEPTKPQYIPPSVWEFLNRPINEQDEQLTFREELINGWRQEGRLGAAGSDEERTRIQLLFADGGTLDMLRATIVLMNRELELLIREVMIQMALRKQSLTGEGKTP
ncbi:MAG: hypothetical protein K0S58_2374, partial [Nitrospira sp.]|nr:hypothetical protein [Nitrospira sp.]